MAHFGLLGSSRMTAAFGGTTDLVVGNEHRPQWTLLVHQPNICGGTLAPRNRFRPLPHLLMHSAAFMLEPSIIWTRERSTT